VEKEELVNLVESRLSKYKRYEFGGTTDYVNVPAEEILSIPLPQEILELRQNYSPTLGDFLEVGKNFKWDIKYELYVVNDKSREDYGDIVITAILYPLEFEEEIGKKLLQKAVSKPDENEVIISLTGVFRRMWWD
jgi:hypothetical protein